MGARKLSVLVLLLGVALSQTAAEKREVNTLANKLKAAKVADPAGKLAEAESALEGFAPILNVEGILNFENEKHVKAAQRYIDALSDSHAYKVSRQYGNRIPAKTFASLNINAGYEQFEKQFKFKSLRQRFYAEWLDWVNSSDSPDSDLNPDKDTIPGNSLRTILNVYSEIKIGKWFYRLKPNGHKKYSTLKALVASRQGFATSDSLPLARMLGPTPGCGTNKFLSQHNVNASGLSGVYCTVRHYLLFGVPTAQATVHNTWRPSLSSSWLGVFGFTYARSYGRVSGFIWDPLTSTFQFNWCNNSQNYNTVSPISSVTDNPYANHMLTVNYFAENGWTRGNLLGINNNNGEFNFCWGLTI